MNVSKNSSKKIKTRPQAKPLKKFFDCLGPGLITGASDDDPSGIATYSQCGAQFGVSMLWTMLFSFPFMVVIQEICGRVGRCTGLGLGGNLKRHYSAWLSYPAVVLLLAANIINLGVDLGAMAAGVQLLMGGSALYYCVIFAVVTVILEVTLPYSRYVNVLKWLTLSLFSYVAIVFVLRIPWKDVLISTFVPHLQLNAESLKMFIAILGTTISPYLFFWQASQEVEEIGISARAKPLIVAPKQATVELGRIHTDTMMGMGVSNLIAIFIMICTAITLHQHGIRQIDSAAQAAEALRPIAGNLCFFLFSLGIVGTGLLAVPVLAGSAAYAVGEVFDWPMGLERKASDAKAFYGVIAVSTFFGLLINLMKINPVQALVYAAIINGIAAVPLLALLTLMASNPKVMQQFVISKRIKIMAWLTTALMAVAAIGLVVTSL